MTKPRVTYAVSVAFLMSLTATGRSQQRRASGHRGPKTALVKVSAYDCRGGPALTNGKLISFKDTRTGVDQALRFHPDRAHLSYEATNIPYGNFRLLLSQPGFPQAERSVDVRQPEVLVDVCLSTAAVHIAPVYANGSPSRLAITVRSFKSAEGGLELAGRFKANAARGVPYGTYKLRAYAKGFWPVERDVDVFQPTVWVIISPSVGEGTNVPAPAVTLSGVVENINKGDQPVYVRLLGLFSGAALDGRVKVSGSSGNFTVEGMLRDRMAALLVLGPGGILCHRLVDLTQVTPPHPLLIRLPRSARTAEPHGKR